MSSINAAHLAYLRTLMRDLNLSPTALARKANIASTTLTRALNDPDHKFALSSTTIAKIAEATGFSPAPFLEAEDYTDVALGRITKEPNANQWSTYVIGEARVGMWMEPAMVSVEEYPPLPITYKGFEHYEVFALKIGDRSVENFAREGDYVICVKPGETDHEFRTGDHVVVQRRRDDGALVELTVRRLASNKDGMALEFNTSDPKFSGMEPIVTDPDAEEIQLIGVVHFMLRFDGSSW